MMHLIDDMLHPISTYWLEKGFLVLTIFYEGAYLTFKSIFHKALNLF